MELWSRTAREALPYTPGEQPRTAGLIKLNTNENPYPPSPAVLDVLRGADESWLRLYPDPASAALCDVIARRHGVPADMVFCGNGSDEVLALCFPAYFDPEARVRYADITYSFYEVYARLFGVKPDVAPLRKDFSLDVEAFAHADCGVLIANPNAPTSRAVTRADLAHIAAHNPHIVIVDEAYAEFGAQSALPLLASHRNILIVKTLSKSHGLAGLRVGYALGDAALIQALWRIKDCFNSYPLDALAQRCAAAALADEAYTQRTIAKVLRTREETVRTLQPLGFNVQPSSANFLFISHASLPAGELMAGLRARNILVRHFNKPRISNHLRVTIGTPQQMSALVCALTELI